MRYLLLLFIISTAFFSAAQQAKITGVVRSSAGKHIPYALIADTVSNKGVYADNRGFFVLNTSGATSVLKISHVSYAPKSMSVEARRDTFITVVLDNLEIPEVLVRGTSLSRQAMLGLNIMEGKMIRNVPNFFGEPDLIKTMTILPGISAGLDLYSGMYVRGGNRDQNLFLVDGARYYTTSHAGGYLSLFNPDIIDHVDVYKGVAPARYGDGLSSVVDVKLTNGGTKPRMNVDIGTLRSGFLLESRGDKKFYGMLAGRFSYYNLITGSATKEFVNFRQLDGEREFYKFSFWDVDGKAGYTPTPRTSVTLGVHLGSDEDAAYIQGSLNPDGVNRKVKDQNGTYIDNHNATLNIRHLFQSGLSIKSTSWFTYYNMKMLSLRDYFHPESYQPQGTVHYQRSSFIQDLSNKIEISKPLGDNHYVSAGVQLSSFWTNPMTGFEEDGLNHTDSIFGYDTRNSLEAAFFADDNIQLGPKTKLNIGLRASLLNTTDTSYHEIEPRVMLAHELLPGWTVKAGYARTSQPFSTLLQMYGYYEEESWLLANSEYKPQRAGQFSGGVSGSFPGTLIEVSVEGYYKTMKNLLFLDPVAYEQKSVFDYVHKNGEGQAYGSEFMLKNSSGKLQWSVAYTLSWSKRKFATLNQGEWFDASFDRRHDVNIGLHYFSGKKNTWNMNYLYQSGRPYTMPKGYFGKTNFYNGFYVMEGLNNARTPAYQRFDISYKRKGKMFGGRTFELTLAVMNLFGHKNPFNMYIRDGNLYMTYWYRVLPSANFKLYLFKK
jgi:hypothetical protein